MSMLFGRSAPACWSSQDYSQASRSAAVPPAAHGLCVTQQYSIASATYTGSGCQVIPQISTVHCCRGQHSRCHAVPKTARVGPIDVEKEAHKIFDEAVIAVRSGSGGDGEIVEAGRGKWVANLKYHAGANQPKKIWLPASEPAEGADGADIVIVCDPALDTLLHLHKRKEWAGKRGAQGNPAVGSAGAKRSKDKKAATTPLEIPVPPGTVVKRKGTGQVLGEVLQPGDRLVVAFGGKGGRGVVAPSRMQKHKEMAKEQKRAQKAGAEVYAVEDINWKDDSKGLPGQQLSLQLLLRVVADVGLVGFPNAGKSSLLAALTRASPEVAPYPFTTLMPNLGVLSAGGSGPVLADLPGLIEGAHLGKGLGRMFLRHLRRTRLLLQVVDASAEDPGTDYLAVREELRMYNPDYVTRPHVVALNKVDLEDAGGLQQEITEEVMSAAHQLQQQYAQEVPGITAPAAVVPCSAITGEGLQELAAALQSVLQELSMKDSKGSSAIAQHVMQQLEQEGRERAQQRRQQLMQQAQQLQEQQEQAQQQRAVETAGIAAAVSAALGVSMAAAVAEPPAEHSSEAGFSDEGSDEGEWEDEGEWGEGELEEGEGGDGGEWDTLDLDGVDLASLAGPPSSSEEGDEADEEEFEGPPPTLPADHPDAWLLELSEEELLNLAD